MTIEEKALELAIYDGYYDIAHKGIIQYHNFKTNNLTTKQKLIKEYSSFDKLMELFERANNNYYFIRLDSDSPRVCLYVINEKGLNVLVFSSDKESRKEALMDCLLEYYKQTKGE